MNKIFQGMDMRMSIVCREVDKSTGHIATYLCKNEINEHDLFIAQMRSRANPEITYYSIPTSVAEDSEELNNLLYFLKCSNLNETAIRRYGGIVKL